MYDRRLDLEEKLFLASLKLQKIHWDITRECQATVILNQMEHLQSELSIIIQDFERVEIQKSSSQ